METKPCSNKMPFDSRGRRIAVKSENGTSRRTTLCLCCVILAIPAGSLYIGYAIGMYFAPIRDVLPDRGVVMDSSRLNYTWYNSHNITIEFAGGLGNQLFQYATLYGVAKANGLKPIISAKTKLPQMFPFLKAKQVGDMHPGTTYEKFRELKAMAFDGRTFMLNFMKNIQLRGFFQSWRYFDHVRADIHQQFTFPPDAVQQVQEVLSEAMIGAKEKFFDAESLSEFPAVYVGIHVRRGDLLSDDSISKGYVTAGESYFNVAMDYFIRKYHNVIFIVCSDDMEWSQQHIKRRGSNPVIFSPFEEKFPAIDLCLLSQCNHTIMTVGTFGWWGAWLAGGETTYYKKFPKPWTPVSEEIRHSDFYPPHWHAI